MRFLGTVTEKCIWQAIFLWKCAVHDVIANIFSPSLSDPVLDVLVFFPKKHTLT